MPTLSPSQLAVISRRTLGHYDTHAEDFWIGTRDHDVSQNIHALLDAITAEPPWQILDFGCGPGRDLIALKEAGHVPTGLEGADALCRMARELSGCNVLHQDFLALDLPTGRFHGVFANASLFHVPGQELPRVLGALHKTLLPGGVLFSSNPRGPNVEGWNQERYGAYHDLAAWTAFLTDSGFDPIGHYYRPPGRPRPQQPWLASTWRKRGD
jgi:SAM-dependent methyltransferase